MRFGGETEHEPSDAARTIPVYNPNAPRDVYLTGTRRSLARRWLIIDKGSSNVRQFLVAAAITLMGSTGAFAIDGGDPATGEQNFRQCMACHQVGPTAVNGVGPELNGIIGRPVASVAGYAYSPNLTAKAAEVGDWSEETLMEYLADPTTFIGGPSKMPMRYPDEQFRRDVLAYLAQFDASGASTQ